MRIVGISDLVADIYYDKKKKLIGIDGGITTQNILCYLSYFGFYTKSIGICGKDKLGEICIKSLKDCNVDIKDIEINPNIKTKSYYIYNILKDKNYVYRSVKECPYCKKNHFYDESYINVNKVLYLINKDDLLIFDDLNEVNIEIINKTKNIKFIDLGSCNNIELINNNILIEILNKFKIINFNEKVFNYLLKKLNVTELELIKLLKSDLIMITKGIKGASYYYKDKEYYFPLNNIVKEVDDSGCGDISFSVIIKNYLNNNKKINIKLLSEWYKETVTYTSKIIKLVGSRTLIKPMYKIKEEDICKK